jgi:two-component system CheB/CheR fusion protein
MKKTNAKINHPANKPKEQKINNEISFPIVGIGASAGGLEALEQFFGNMPKDCSMAFVVIQHLDPNHAGIMPELLQRITTMKVSQASDNLKVKPNCVYVIPPNKSLSILNGALLLFDPIESRGLRLPVDIFFRSLADDQQGKSIGIILSGMGSDGSMGLKAIKEKNGIVLVQSPDSAKFDGMPRSAIDAVIADIVAPAQELPSKLIEFLKFIPAAKSTIEFDDKSKSNIDKIIILLREQMGHDFSLYKKNTLFRRIERRKGVHQIDKLNSYVRFCQENPKEVEILFKELMIGVTNFFRDAALWEKLKEKVFPEMINRLPDGAILRAWVAACSTGEEAYSLAITFLEALEKTRNHKNISLQIFATDLDQDAVDKARKGIYPQNIVNDVSPERLNHFFKAEPDGFRIVASVREMVVFAPQDLIKDPPFTKLDILTCRNMLIYLETELQKKLITLFNYSLNHNGVLILGSAETIGNSDNSFKEIDSKLKIYTRANPTRVSELTDFPSSFIHRKVSRAELPAVSKNIENIQGLADQVLLQRFAPASVLVNENGDIIYMTGPIGKYLEPVAGKANYNIYVMAREGLRNELPGALRKAIQNIDKVSIPNIKIGSTGGTFVAEMTLQRMDTQNSIRGMIMLVFTELADSFENEVALKNRKRSSTGKVKELEDQLQRSQEELQGIREEMQTSQEELKSMNEELQSTNEELQSTNEELTTSKEEMQSLNEELQTVNAELQSKVSDFSRANDDMKNMLNSTEVATLFLDKELNIRKFTDQVTKIFKLRSTDIGRPFTDLSSDLLYLEIDTDAKQVLKTLSTLENEITTVDGRWFKVRIMPFRTLDDHIDGLVMTFTNITLAKNLEFEVKKANDIIAISETRYRNLFESAKDGILILDAETGKIVDVNPFLMEMLGYSKEQFVEKSIWQIGFLKDIVANKEKFLELQQSELVRYENLPLETADGRKINVEFVSNVYLVADEKVIQCFIREVI